MPNNLRALAAVSAVCALTAGCAATPESIIPSYVSTLTYTNLNCAQLSEEKARVNAAYFTAARQQEHARKNDTVGVILLGLPVGSMTGQNVAPEVANLKGQANAINEVETQKSCDAATLLPPLPPDAHPYSASKG